MSKLDASQILQTAKADSTNAPSGILQRKCASCNTHTVAGDKCEDCKNKKGVLQRKSSNNSEQSEVPPIVHEVLNSSGQPLDKSTRTFFESRFSHNFSKVPINSVSQQLSPSSLTVGSPTDVYEQEADRVANSVMLKEKNENKSSSTKEQQDKKFDLSHVRVHTDARAAKSADAVNALAYTVGNNIVFGAGQFAPETHKGRRLIAHELTHVMQQSGSDVIRGEQGDKKGRLPAITSMPNQLIQREDKAADKATEEAKNAALLQIEEIESNWMEIRDQATAFSDVDGWLKKGDIVIKLLRTHTDLALDGMDNGDSALVKFMTSIVESDLLMYSFIAWHVVVFVNLLSIEPKLKGYADSFAADSRSFTGRAQAEVIVKLLTQLAAGYRKQSPKLLDLVKILPADVTTRSGNKITLTVTIAAHPDKSVTSLFEKEIGKFMQDQSAVQILVGETNQFFANATKEGLIQAAEAVVEFVTVRGSSRRGPKASKKGKDNKKAEKKGKKGKWGCQDVRCNVYQNLQEKPLNPNCPDRVIGEVPYIFPDYNAACLAVQKAANLLVPRGCVKRHCNCKTKCTQK